MDVTPKDVQEFVNEKWQTLDCPRCGENNWGLGSPDRIKSVLPIGDDDAASIYQSQALPAYWVICLNCGHIELIGAKTVRAWKETRREEANT